MHLGGTLAGLLPPPRTASDAFEQVVVETDFGASLRPGFFQLVMNTRESLVEQIA
jgi:hypothetical protein